MKQFKIINAYNNTEVLASNNNLSETELWNVFQLRKTLHPHVEFQNERENAIRDKYIDFAVDGKLTGEPFQNYVKDMEELGNLDKEVEFKKFKITLKEGLGLNVHNMEALEDFVEFVCE